jgi:hypothetical protein
MIVKVSSHRRQRWSLVALLLTAALPSVARGEEAARGRWEYQWFGVEDVETPMDFCVLLPYQRCRRALDVSISYGGGREYGAIARQGERSDTMQLAADGGYLHQVSESPSLQLGPMIGFEAELFQEEWRFRLYATARARLWIGRWVTFESALGVVGSFERGWTPRGIGGLAELAFTLHGHLGFYVQTQVTSGPEGAETRVTAGFRGSFVTWAVIFAGMAG